MLRVADSAVEAPVRQPAVEDTPADGETRVFWGRGGSVGGSGRFDRSPSFFAAPRRGG